MLRLRLCFLRSSPYLKWKYSVISNSIFFLLGFVSGSSDDAAGACTALLAATAQAHNLEVQGVNQLAKQPVAMKMHGIDRDR